MNPRGGNQNTSRNIESAHRTKLANGLVGIQITTVNSSLRVLRRILGLAAEWGVLESCPKISLLHGERHRDTLVTSEQERVYLDHAPEPLNSIATVRVDTGLRPDYRLRWEDMNRRAGRDGTLRVTHGKTPAAHRTIPMTPRVHA